MLTFDEAMRLYPRKMFYFSEPKGKVRNFSVLAPLFTYYALPYFGEKAYFSRGDHAEAGVTYRQNFTEDGIKFSIMTSEHIFDSSEQSVEYMARSEVHSWVKHYNIPVEFPQEVTPLMEAWIRRFDALYEDESVMEWFDAGILDMKFIDNCRANGIGLDLALDVRTGMPD